MTVWLKIRDTVAKSPCICGCGAEIYSLNAETTAKLLGISISGMYELMHEKGFPVLKIGTRLVVPREKFREWVEQNVGK